jgi:hypothetical protein
MVDRTPDLKIMLVELARAVVRHHSGAFTDRELDRVAEADNTLLVLSRVLMSAAKRIGVTDDEVRSIVELSMARPPPRPEDMFEVKVVDADPSSITGRVTDWDVLSAVDGAMADPAYRSELPGWFVDEFWPPVVRRCASGVPMTDRDKAVAMHVVSVARGER